MFKFKHIVLLVVFCLFSSAVFGSDKVAEQIFDDCKTQMEKDKQAGIAKLKLRLDAVRKTGNAENIKQIEDMIAELGGETDASETATDASTKNTEEDTQCSSSALH